MTFGVVYSGVMLVGGVSIGVWGMARNNDTAVLRGWQILVCGAINAVILGVIYGCQVAFR